MRKLLALAVLLAACGNDSGMDPPPTSGEVTYYQNIKPIFDAKCVTCHSDGGIAPFALADYQAAAEYGPIAAHVTEQRTMPPWPANNDCRDYEANRSLDQSQIDAIAQWVEQGLLEGDPAQPGPAIASTATSMSRVDATLQMPEAYSPMQMDDYRCFVLPWPSTYTQTTYVTGFRAVPDNDKTVHHVIAFLAAPADVATFQQKDAAEPGPGYTCFGGANGPIKGMIGGWAPGSLGSDLPPGIGLPVEAGSAIILQVHYNMANGSGPDRSAIEMKIDSTVDRPGRVLPFTNPNWTRGNMMIAANDPAASYSFEVDPTFLTGELEIFSAGHHMHTRGKTGKMGITRPNGDKSCLLQIDDWNFHWQGSYGFTKSEILHRGDKLSISCTWDNSGNGPVNWGEGTADEMCIGFLLTAAPKLD